MPISKVFVAMDHFVTRYNNIRHTLPFYRSHLWPSLYFMHLLLSSHNQDTIHAEKWCVEIHNFCMADLLFFTGHGVKARTHVHEEIIHFPAQCIIRTWNALDPRPCASQALTMRVHGKCVISAWSWLLALMLLCPIIRCNIRRQSLTSENNSIRSFMFKQSRDDCVRSWPLINLLTETGIATLHLMSRQSSHSDWTSNKSLRIIYTHYWKNPFPMRNHIIHNKATIAAQEPQACRSSGS